VRTNATIVSDPSQRALELMNPRGSDGYGELAWVTVELEVGEGAAPADGSEPVVQALFDMSLTNARVAPTAAQAATSKSNDGNRDRKRATETEYLVDRTSAVTNSTQLGAVSPVYVQALTLIRRPTFAQTLTLGGGGGGGGGGAVYSGAVSSSGIGA
jgi:hypothetical protein